MDLKDKGTISKQFGKTKEAWSNSFDFIVLISSFDSLVLFTSVGTIIECKVLPN